MDEKELEIKRLWLELSEKSLDNDDLRYIIEHVEPLGEQAGLKLNANIGVDNEK